MLRPRYDLALSAPLRIRQVILPRYPQTHFLATSASLLSLFKHSKITGEELCMKYTFNQRKNELALEGAGTSFGEHAQHNAIADAVWGYGKYIFSRDIIGGYLSIKAEGDKVRVNIYGFSATFTFSGGGDVDDDFYRANDGGEYNNTAVRSHILRLLEKTRHSVEFTGTRRFTPKDESQEYTSSGLDITLGDLI